MERVRNLNRLGQCYKVMDETEANSVLMRMCQDFSADLTHQLGKLFIFTDASLEVSGDKKESPELVIRFKVKDIRC